MDQLYFYMDPVLIQPYRWLSDPVWAWWLGTVLVTALAILVGELTVALGKKLNRRILAASSGEAREMERKSMQALRAGDKAAYKALNRQANEAFGQSFFQKAALGASSLWSAFMVAGWVEARFAGLGEIPLPGVGASVSWVQAYIASYLALRLGLAGVRRLRGKVNSHNM